MGLFDFFKIGELQDEIKRLKKENEKLSTISRKRETELLYEIENYKKAIAEKDRIIGLLQPKVHNESAVHTSAEAIEVNNATTDEDIEILYSKQIQAVSMSSVPEKALLEYCITNKGVIITKYLGDEEKVNIPPVIESRVVYRIGKEAFKDCKNLKVVNLPDCIAEIGEAAFKYSGLEDIVFPDELHSIEYEAFYGTRLRKIIIPKGIKTIKCKSFASTKLKVVLIKGAQRIDCEAFEWCPIERLVLPDTLEYIGKNNFKAIGKQFVIPQSVKKVEYGNIPLDAHIAVLSNDTEVWLDYSWEYTNYNKEKIPPIIYCNVGSKAHLLAREKGLEYKPLSDFPIEIIEEEDEDFDSFDEDDETDEENTIDGTDYDDEERDNEDDDGGEESGGNYYEDGELDTSSWNLESVLRQEGYTVSQKEGLTDSERQSILKNVINRNLMSKWQIIEHIELQISLRKNNSMYNIAISKWERDLSFLRRL